MRRALASLVSLGALTLAAPAFAADHAGCTIVVVRSVAGIATHAAECRWPVAPRFVAAIVGDPQRIADASTALAESTRLPDGRILNVHSAGWPIADRQSTLATERAALERGGVLLTYTLARQQAPLGAGRVQARRDDGLWEIRADEDGATHLLHETTYDANGRLPVALVQRTVRSSLAESLAEIRAAAETLARSEARRTEASANERKRARAGARGAATPR